MTRPGSTTRWVLCHSLMHGYWVSCEGSVWVIAVIGQRYGSLRLILECVFIDFFLVHVQILQIGPPMTHTVEKRNTWVISESARSLGSADAITITRRLERGCAVMEAARSGLWEVMQDLHIDKEAADK